MDPRVERTRARVVEAAWALMDEGGPAAITYSALAERSGVGRATLYRHWPDLACLGEELRSAFAARFQADLTGDLAADLENSMRTMVGILRRQAQGGSLIAFLQRARSDPAAREELARVEQMNPVRMALRAALARGDLPQDSDLDRLSAQLLGPLLYRALMTASDVDDAFAASIVRAFLAGLPGGHAPSAAGRED
jgi:AcrR family transcriptional regulator